MGHARSRTRVFIGPARTPSARTHTCTTAEPRSAHIIGRSARGPRVQEENGKRLDSKRPPPFPIAAVVKATGAFPIVLAPPPFPSLHVTTATIFNIFDRRGRRWRLARAIVVAEVNKERVPFKDASGGARCWNRRPKARCSPDANGSAVAREACFSSSLHPSRGLSARGLFVGLPEPLSWRIGSRPSRAPTSSARDTRRCDRGGASAMSVNARREDPATTRSKTTTRPI